MTTVKRITDLTQYASVLPFASEMFGVFQPLLGWKSKRMIERAQQGYAKDREQILRKLKEEFVGGMDVKLNLENRLTTNQPSFENRFRINLKPGFLKGGKTRAQDSVVLQAVANNLPAYEHYDPSVWERVINPDQIDKILQSDVAKFYTTALTRSPEFTSTVERQATDLRLSAFAQQLNYESSMAGALLFLAEEKAFDVLEELFYAEQDKTEQAEQLVKLLQSEHTDEIFLDLENIDPQELEDLRSVAISPIGVVHLFRQYFFELDTFLGTPESHVWLSPGSSVELIEVHTRKSRIEKTLESTLELLTSSETSTTTEEEISEAVKQDNTQDIKFGASVTAKYASIEATSSFDYANSQQIAREESHKRTRQQTEKLSSQIRKNFKSTFKTITELTEVSSSKHVLANSTDNLINYELRRKMRQVGIQVQDIGTFLCWQTYVDDPGKALGIANLIHIAKPPELDGIPHPEEIPLLQPMKEEKMITIPFVSVDDTGADNKGEVYVDGVEVNDEEWFGNLEKIQADFNQEFVSPRANYNLTNVEFDPLGKPIQVSRGSNITNSNNRARFVLHLDSADFQGQNSVQIKLILHWSPNATANDPIIAKNEANLANFKAAEKAAFEKAYIENAKERVTLASKIAERKAEDLRSEEQIVVYRALIQDLLMNGVPVPDDRTRHVVAELINAIFDVDKMLYFVAPEWWRPRLHQSQQQLQAKAPKKPKSISSSVALEDLANFNMVASLDYLNERTNLPETDAMSANSVSWGGADDSRRDNYYITEESDPAKLGSSLGWLLQLDGDNMRNAFLNAPWVKAVLPIRPGKEKAAINWLKAVEGMNGITDDVIYHANNPEETDVDGNPLEGQKMMDVLYDLAEKIRRKHREGIETGKFPKEGDVSDPALVDEENTVTSTPIDRVYEHGFYPLNGSFRANVTGNYEIFDQWTEILPTDQIVPVEVQYDPKTGRQIDPS